MFTDPSFRMMVEDVFVIRGRGVVVTGQIEIGEIRVGNEVYIHGSGETRTAVINSIEMFHRRQQRAQAGDRVGLILAGISKEEVQPGDALLGTA